MGGPAEARGALGPQGPAPCHTAVLFPRRPLDGNTCLSQRHSWAPLQVLHGDTDILFPVSGVGSYSPAGGCFWWAFLDRSFLLPEPGLREPAGVGPPLPGGVGAGRRGPRQQGLWRQKRQRAWLHCLLSLGALHLSDCWAEWAGKSPGGPQACFFSCQ